MRGEPLKGHLDTLLLAVVADGAVHGYGIVELLRERSGGQFELPEGTVYPALHRLENDGLLRSEWAVIGGRRRRQYSSPTAGAPRSASDHMSGVGSPGPLNGCSPPPRWPRREARHDHRLPGRADRLTRASPPPAGGGSSPRSRITFRAQPPSCSPVGMRWTAAEREAVRRFGPAQALVQTFHEDEAARAARTAGRASLLLAALLVLIEVTPPGILTWGHGGFPAGLLGIRVRPDRARRGRPRARPAVPARERPVGPEGCDSRSCCAARASSRCARG